MGSEFKFDEIGYWSELKLEIIERYASEYTKILTSQQAKGLRLDFWYIDAFSSCGISVSKKTGEEIYGSALRSLNLEHPFRRYVFIDKEKDKIDYLQEKVSSYQDKGYNIEFFNEDCNEILLAQIFPSIKWTEYKRALCLLDPYGLDLDWKVMEKAGKMRTIEIFLNFPVMDMNRNAIWRQGPEKISDSNLERMNRFWGDNSWKKAAYKRTETLFEEYPDIQKQENQVIVDTFKKRLKKNAGFNYIPDPIPMVNSKGATIYYLFFASQKPVAAKIVNEIFNKYRNYSLKKR